MKKMILGAAALALMFTACKKKEEESKPSNFWKVGSNTYTALQVNSTGGGILTAATTENGGNSIGVTFNGNSLPTTGGTYIVKQTTTADNEVSVIATESSTAGVYTVGSGTLTVTVNNGKVTVDMPASNAQYQGMTTKPDAAVSLHLTQQ
jgi:hypothetical protein